MCHCPRLLHTCTNGIYEVHMRSAVEQKLRHALQHKKHRYGGADPHKTVSFVTPVWSPLLGTKTLTCTCQQQHTTNNAFAGCLFHVCLFSCTPNKPMRLPKAQKQVAGSSHQDGCKYLRKAVASTSLQFLTSCSHLLISKMYSIQEEVSSFVLSGKKNIMSSTSSGHALCPSRAPPSSLESPQSKSSGLGPSFGALPLGAINARSHGHLLVHEVPT